LLTILTEGIGYFTVADANAGDQDALNALLRYPRDAPMPAWLRKGPGGALSLHGPSAPNTVRARDFRAVVARRLPRPLYLWLRRGWRARPAN
jgi:hypothetical protein